MASKLFLLFITFFVSSQVVLSALSVELDASQDYQTRFNNFRVTHVIQALKIFWRLLEGTKLAFEKIKQHIHEQDAAYTEEINNCLKATAYLENLNRSTNIVELIQSRIKGEVLSEDNEAAFKQYLDALLDVHWFAVRVLSLSHEEEVPVPYSFVGDDLKSIREDSMKRYEEFDKEIQSNFGRFMSTLSAEEKDKNKDVVEFYENYRNEENWKKRLEDFQGFIKIRILP